MLKMVQIEYIKELYENKELSLREISMRTGHSFNTIKKYACQEDFSKKEKQKSKSRKAPVLGKYTDTIDKWLTEDLKAPRKQRHTIVRIYDRLKDEHGYAGSYSTVRDYVRKKKKLFCEEKTGFLPLEQPKGYAQADFGEFQYTDINGKNQTGYALTVSFPGSNKGYIQAFPSQNRECLLTGLQRIFEYIGGAPICIRFDNMKTVVAQVKEGRERVLTDDFLRFMLHYRFKAEFCNPACGNEKGNVENKVGYTRRNALVPKPKIVSFDEFNERLFKWCEEDAKREHYRHKVSIKSLWEIESKELLPLPRYGFPIFRHEATSVNKYGFCTIETNKYGLSPSLAGETVETKIYYDTIEFFYEGQKVGNFKRSYGQNQEICDWTQYLPILIKKPSAASSTRFFNQMPEQWRPLIKDSRTAERKNVLKLLYEIYTDGNIGLCNDAVLMALENGRTDADSIRQCYYMITKRENHPKPLEIESSVPQLTYTPNLSTYDTLTGGAL